MTTLIEVSAEDDKRDIKLVRQLQLFDDITDEDIRKTIFLLSKYTHMIDTIRNFEVAMKEIHQGLNAFELLAAEGTVARRESSSDLVANIPESAAILKEKRQAIYKLYQAMTTIIRCALVNIRDPHESLVAKLLFLDGWKYLKAQQYCEHSYRKDVPAISGTTFADKRRRVIANCANTFKLNGALDFVIIDYGRGRHKNGECTFRLPGWERN
jgi:hypothetical protein